MITESEMAVVSEPATMVCATACRVWKRVALPSTSIGSIFSKKSLQSSGDFVRPETRSSRCLFTKLMISSKLDSSFNLSIIMVIHQCHSGMRPMVTAYVAMSSIASMILDLSPPSSMGPNSDPTAISPILVPKRSWIRQCGQTHCRILTCRGHCGVQE